MAALSRSNLLRNSWRSLAVTNLRRSLANKAYPEHIPLNTFEHAFLTVGTGLAALLDPKRGGEYYKFDSFGRSNSPTAVRYGCGLW